MVDGGGGVIVVTASTVVGGRTMVVGRGCRCRHTVGAGGGGPLLSPPSSPLLMVVGWWSHHCHTISGMDVIMASTVVGRGHRCHRAIDAGGGGPSPSVNNIEYLGDITSM